MPYDTWNVACAPFLLPPFLLGENYQQNCLNGGDPADAGPDHDFAQGPILYTVNGKDRLGIGQKSSVYWILDPATGEVVSQTRTGPGGLAGGHQWGSAYDGVRIYTSDSNSNGIAYTLADGITTTSAGIFSALDARTGGILWQIANPAGEQAGSPASVANGVMYVCSMGSAFGANQGQMYAIGAATGQVRWTFVSGSSCGGGASIANGMVFWGTGYTSLGGSAGSRLFAFGL